MIYAAAAGSSTDRLLLPGVDGEMDFGAFLPYIVPTQIDRQTFVSWCKAIDDGPFSTLAHGERWAWATPEHVTTLAAAAIGTERVRLWSYTFNVPMHPADFVAKRAATIDLLSDGRYEIVVGVGGQGRTQDWISAEKPPQRFPHARPDEQIVQLRRSWAGEPPRPDAKPIGPLPAQPGGPRIHCSSAGPKSLARAAKWADGYGGFIGPLIDSPDASAPYLAEDAIRVRAAWHQAGRSDAPYLTTSCFYALGPGAKQRLGDIGAAYMKIKYPDVSSNVFWIHDEDAVRLVVDAARAAGFDQVIFIPTTDDLDELRQLSRLLEGLG